MAKASNAKGKKPLSDMPWFFFKYLDKEQTSEFTPYVNLPELQPPDFKWEKESVYDGFWSPNGETLPQAKLRLKEIKRYPAGSGCEGPGFYPGVIMLSGSTKAEAMMKKEEQRLKEPSSKCLEAIMNKKSVVSKQSSSKAASQSSTSGYSSSTAASKPNIKKAKNSKQSSKGKERKEVGGSKSESEKDDTRNCATSQLEVFDPEPECSGFSCSDSDDSVVPAKSIQSKVAPLEEEIKVLKRKNLKLKDKIHCLEKDLRSSEEAKEKVQQQLIKILSFNVIYQEHIIMCGAISSETKNEKEKESSSDTDKSGVHSKNSEVVDQRVQAPLKSTQMKSQEGSTEAAKISVRSDETPEVRGVESQSEPVDAQVPPSIELEDMRSRKVHHPANTATEKTTENVSHPETAALEDERDAAGTSSNQTTDDQLVKIYNNIYIDKEAYTRELQIILGRVDASKNGKEKDKEFVMLVTETLFSEVELATHCVTGSLSNVQKGLIKKGKVTADKATALPALDAKRVAAVKNVFLRRIMMEKEDAAISEEERKAFIVERYVLKNIHQWMGASCHNAKRRAMRATKKVAGNPQEEHLT